jgi:hypothetical protein
MRPLMHNAAPGPAVDGDDLAGDGTGPRRDQQEHRIGDILRRHHMHDAQVLL